MKKIFVLVLILGIMGSCKNDFLSVKPDKKFVVPTTLEDVQALLDYNEVMNFSSPKYGEVSSDDYFVLSNTWNTLSNLVDKNAYVWAKDPYHGINIQIDWNNGYMKVFYANNALELLKKLKESEDLTKVNQLRGTALFYRSQAFFELAQLFSAPYKNGSLNDGLGIPIRVQSDINLPSKRTTIDETYKQIINDLLESVELLPEKTHVKTRPVKAAAHAMLSRVYLSMQKYSEALIEAENVLTGEFQLMDYNLLDSNVDYPINHQNSEAIFHSRLGYASLLHPIRSLVDTLLFRSYSENDLRRTLFFINNNSDITYRGSYDGSIDLFNGLAIDECFLTKVECLARQNEIENALLVLNNFLITRYKSGTMKEYTIDSQEEILKVVLMERRKQLLYRGIRWMDLRRLNLEPSTATVIYRDLNGDKFKLEPNSKNYVLPIPPGEIELSGIEQNDRE